MEGFKARADKLISLVKSRQQISFAELPYLCNVSPNYLRALLTTACAVGEIVVDEIPGRPYSGKYAFTQNRYDELEKEWTEKHGEDHPEVAPKHESA